MNLPKNILYEILYFLDWREYATICDKLGISLKFNIYVKYNNSLENFDNCREYLNNISYQNKNMMNCASFYGHLEIVQYLHSIDAKCTTGAMNRASRSGHLEIVKYLHSIGKECTTYAMDYASMYGHLEIVRYLHSIGKDSTTWAMDFASKYGHLEIVKYLKSIQL